MLNLSHLKLPSFPVAETSAAAISQPSWKKTREITYSRKKSKNSPQEGRGFKPNFLVVLYIGIGTFLNS